ncbi:MAG: nicotinate-nucleotide adenylyltransferase [Chloroflexota bacterium]
MKLGIFGGTFDPPHVGHLILAEQAYIQFGLDRLLWVLTPDPPHKQDRHISPAAIRLKLLQAALGEHPNFEVSTVDIDRPGPHYALDTVKILAKAYPGAALMYLMGGDSLHDLPRWHRAAELVKTVDTLGVMRRPGDDVNLACLERQLPGVSAKVHFIETPPRAIAASTIRQRIAAGLPYQHDLPPDVRTLIQKLNLYQNHSERNLL